MTAVSLQFKCLSACCHICKKQISKTQWDLGMTIQDLYKNSGYTSEWESSEQKMRMLVFLQQTLHRVHSTLHKISKISCFCAEEYEMENWETAERRVVRWLREFWSEMAAWALSTQYAVCYCQYRTHFQWTKSWKNNTAAIALKFTTYTGKL